MGRDCSKASGNVYFEARKAAAEYDDRLYSREKAAELLGVSVSTLADYENGNTKFVPVDKVVLMADLYHQPELKTGYCKHECPIGACMPFCTKTSSIAMAALKVLKGLDDSKIDSLRHRIIDVAADGQVDASEKPELAEILKNVDEIGYPKKPMCCKLPNRCGGLGFCIIDEEKGRDLTIYNKFGMNRYITFDMLLELAKNCHEDIIMQEYEEGLDYSMCVLADHGRVLHALGFEGYLMAFGSAMFAGIKQNEQALAIAKQIVADTGLDGNVCFDFILKEDGSVKLLETNPRLSASLPFIAKAGLNLPYLRCRQLLGYDVENIHPEINYKLRMSKNYESEYFV
ncbi:MAG: ATP-grasp domain-containing protein [Faecalibacterium prausnitzii]